MKFRITLLLLTIILPVLSSADVPDYLESDTISEICKKVNCHSEFDNYYRTKYIAKKFHKALAISSTKSGNRYGIDYFAMAWNYPTHTEAKREALKACYKHGKNCEIFFVNNRIDNEELYESFTKTVNVSSYSSQKCSSGYYKDKANSSCLKLPLNAIKYSSDIGYYCKSGYKKSGNKCIKKSTASSSNIPANAHPSGNSWICNIDYYRSSNLKSCVRVPRDAYSTYTSNYWYCKSGYKKSGNKCIKENNIPANAHASGSGWVCNTNYYKNGSLCQRVPANSYATGYGAQGWKCNSGFIQSGSSCISKINIPNNAYATSSLTQGWKCNYEYYQSGSSCIKKIQIPINSYKVGASWKCNDGYYQNSKSTKCLKVPKNASKNSNDRSWTCNYGFRRVGSSCKEKIAEIYIDGHRYVGEIDNYRRPHGFGTMTYINGGSYAGSWINGKTKGQGTFVTKQGVSVSGVFNAADIIGIATVTYLSGNVYKGGFNLNGNSKGRNGPGIMIYSDGEIKEGIWIANKFQETLIIGDDSNGERESVSGSGFAVRPDGYVVTNYHVINGCNNVEIIGQGSKISVEVISSDKNKDLALLKGDFIPPHILPLSTEDPYRNMSIVVAGFPFGSKFGSTLKMTSGIVSNTFGYRDNPSQIQFDAPIQPGNSGGPIIDKKGNVIAVTAYKLDPVRMKEQFGAAPEGTNFGIKSTVLIDFLGKYINKTLSMNTKEVDERVLGEIAENSTYYISCLMTMAQIEANKSKNINQRKVLFTNFE